MLNSISIKKSGFGVHKVSFANRHFKKRILQYDFFSFKNIFLSFVFFYLVANFKSWTHELEISELYLYTYTQWCSREFFTKRGIYHFYYIIFDIKIGECSTYNEILS
jgi:hypothetical protein